MSLDDCFFWFCLFSARVFRSVWFGGRGVAVLRPRILLMRRRTAELANFFHPARRYSATLQHPRLLPTAPQLSIFPLLKARSAYIDLTGPPAPRLTPPPRTRRLPPFPLQPSDRRRRVAARRHRADLSQSSSPHQITPFCRRVWLPERTCPPPSTTKTRPKTLPKTTAGVGRVCEKLVGAPPQNRSLVGEAQKYGVSGETAASVSRVWSSPPSPQVFARVCVRVRYRCFCRNGRCQPPIHA